MSFKIKEWVRVTTARDKNEPYAGYRGLVMDYSDGLYKILFEGFRDPVNGFTEQELELETTQFFPFSMKEMNLLIFALGAKIDTTASFSDRQLYHDLFDKVTKMCSEKYDEAILSSLAKSPL